MTATMNQNGRVRKTLASQIDRLDDILDGLADSLDQAVATAVAEAVREAVQGAIVQILTNPDLQRQMHVISAPMITEPSPAGPSLLERGWRSLKRKGARCREYLASTSAEWIDVAFDKSHRLAARVRHEVRLGWMWMLVLVSLVQKLRRSIVASAVVGLATALVCYAAGPHVASAVSGVAGFTLTLSAAAVNGVRRTFFQELRST